MKVYTHGCVTQIYFRPSKAQSAQPQGRTQAMRGSLPTRRVFCAEPCAPTLFKQAATLTRLFDMGPVAGGMPLWAVG